MAKAKPALVRAALITGGVAVIVAVIGGGSGVFTEWFKSSKKEDPKPPGQQNSISITGSNNPVSGVSGSSNSQGAVNQGGTVQQQQSFGPSSPNIQASNVIYTPVNGQTVSVFNAPVTIVQVSWEQIQAAGIKAPPPTQDAQSSPTNPTATANPPIAPIWYIIGHPGYNTTRQAIAELNGKKVVLVPITVPGGTRLTDNIDFTVAWPHKTNVPLRVFVSDVSSNEDPAAMKFQEKKDKKFGQDPNRGPILCAGSKFEMLPDRDVYFSKRSDTVYKGKVLVFVEDGLSVADVNRLPGVTIR